VNTTRFTGGIYLKLNQIHHYDTDCLHQHLLTKKEVKTSNNEFHRSKKMSKFSNKLKEIREAKKLKQEDVANSLFISRQSLSNYENGRRLPDIVTLIELSNLYEVSLDSLVKNDEELMVSLKNEKRKKQSQRSLNMIGFSLLAMTLIFSVAVILFAHNFRTPSGFIWIKIVLSIFLLIIAIFAVPMNFREIELQPENSKKLWLNRHFGYGWSINLATQKGLIIFISTMIILNTFFWMLPLH
jgi:transcriptional regulator with XRE-family HTH domain